MALLRRISDEDAERLLVGNVPMGEKAHGLETVAAFVAALRTEVPSPPPRGAEGSLIERLSATALESAHSAAAAPTQPLGAASTARRSAWRPRLALAAKVAVAVAVLPAAMAGLAFAGVTLPEPAREAMERIGLDLPNQSAVDDESAAPTDAADEADRAGDDSKASGTGNAGGRSSNGDHGSDSGGATTKRRQDRERTNPNADGDPGHDSRGQGAPQLGEPAPITPPGQGGTPPGQGGTPPGQGGTSPGRSTPQTQSGGPPGGVPPGQAKQAE